MRAVSPLLIAFALGACSQPLLANAPRPNPAAVAGVAAGAAAAATLANPDGAAKRQEATKPEQEPRPKKVKENVPEGVLDRLDDKQRNGSDDAPPPPESSSGAPGAPGLPVSLPGAAQP